MPEKYDGRGSRSPQWWPSRYGSDDELGAQNELSPENGFIVIGVEPFWQQFAIGVVLLVAVYLDQWRRRARTQG